jgi:uncharacterized protein
MPLPETAPEDAAELIFTRDPDELRQPVRRAPAPAPTPTADILAQLAKARPELVPAETPQPQLFDEAERETSITRVMAEIAEDPEAGYRSTAVLYQDFLVRCRIHRIPGRPLDLAQFKRRLAIARAGVDEETAAGEAWQKLLAMSHSLTDDIQGVFLIVAQAAASGAPCPSDAVLARAYGTHSLGRARRLLTYFEERGLLVLRTDFHGLRVAVFPEAECETAPGDPEAPDLLGESRAAAE